MAYTFVRLCQAVGLMWVHFVVYKVYHNKTDFKESSQVW